MSTCLGVGWSQRIDYLLNSTARRSWMVFYLHIEGRFLGHVISCGKVPLLEVVGSEGKKGPTCVGPNEASVAVSLCIVDD